MSAFEDDVEPLEEPMPRASRPGQSALGKRMRELTPEPDEEMDTTGGKHSMWLVKVPRFLLNGWTKVDEEDRRLGTVRVYDPDHRGNQRMELLLPPQPEPAIPLPPSHPYLQTNFPRKYDLRLTSEQGSDRVRNLYAFRERLEGGDDDDDFESDVEDKKMGDDNKILGRRVVSMIGTIANEAALKPQVAATAGPSRQGSASTLTPEYREVLRKRRLEASKPKHSVKVLNESDIGHANMLSSGVGRGFQKGTRASLIAGTGAAAQRNAKAQTEKFARMPRNELLDLLFELFDEYPYWSIKGLRGKVQQPEVYLREVLSSVADLHKRGPYNGNWSLKPMFAEMRKQQRQQTSTSQASTSTQAPAPTNVKSEEGASQATKKEDDNDDEEDMEQVI